MLAERRLLDPIAHDAERRRRRTVAIARGARRLPAPVREIPDTLTNAVLLGSLIVPLGHGPGRRASQPGDNGKEPAPALGMLPLPRRDVERLRQVLGLQRRLTDMNCRRAPGAR